MSKAAGSPSEKCERLPSSPDVRPSQLNCPSLFSSFSCPALPTVSQLQRRHSSYLREARPPEQVCYKHEAQYAMNLFGASPEIDFTIKRGHGAFSPHQGGPRRPIIDVAGGRSENSDKCEAAQTLRFWGAAPYIEVVGRRGTGSCSPRIERRDVEASCLRRQHYLQDCHRSGLSDISEVYRLGAGACSPRLGTLPEASTPANLISQEARIASGHSKLGRAVTISPRVVEVEVPYVSLSRNSSSPSCGSRSSRNVLDDDELSDIPRWAQPTSASRARNAQDLSNVKSFLDGSSPRTTRSCTTASVCSSSRRSSFDDTRDTHSCRFGTDSSAASVKSGSVGTASRCTHSCRYGSEASSLVGCRSVRSSFSSASTTSSLASQKSFKLAGDILSDLKMPKNTSRSSKASSTFRNWYDVPSADYQNWLLPPPAPKLAGNILANLRTSPSRCKGLKNYHESSTSAKDVDSGGHDTIDEL